MPRSILALAVVPAVLISPCGHARTPPPDVTTPAAPSGTETVRSAPAGVSFAAPRGWRRQRAPAAPLVASLRDGRAIVNVFRYPRTEPLPQTRAELRTAGEALVGAAKQRDATLTERSRSVTRVDGRPAVVLRATETIEGQPRTVRSTHVYADGAELVVDAIAPAVDFARVDAAVFRPFVRSLRFTPRGD